MCSAFPVASFCSRWPYLHRRCTSCHQHSTRRLNIAGFSLPLPQQDTKNVAAREGALQAVAALCDDLGPACEPFFAPLLPNLLDKAADKVRKRKKNCSQRRLWNFL